MSNNQATPLDVQALELLWFLGLEDWSFAPAPPTQGNNSFTQRLVTASPTSKRYVKEQMFTTPGVAIRPGYFSRVAAKTVVSHYRNRTS